MDIFERTKLIIDNASLEKLKDSHIAVFGAGGVGGAAIECAARIGFGRITIVDSDVFEKSNLNRQLGSTVSAIGKPKAEVFAARIKDINPEADANPRVAFFPSDGDDMLRDIAPDVVIDAIDSLRSKKNLIVSCLRRGIPCVSSAGMGNRLDPTKLVFEDIFKVTGCPLAKKLRKMLRDEGVEHYEVLVSLESQRPKLADSSAVGSCVFVPNAAGIMLAYKAFLYAEARDSQTAH